MRFVGRKKLGFKRNRRFLLADISGKQFGRFGGEVGDAIKADDANPTRIQNKRLLGRYARTTAFN